MCGIVGYTGVLTRRGSWSRGCVGWSIAGTTSAGVATIDGDELWCESGPAGSDRWKKLLEHEPAPGSCGISHTRWATHGPATDRNAHPHLGGAGRAVTVAVVHNGVIENHAALRARARRRRALCSTARRIPRSSRT